MYFILLSHIHVMYFNVVILHTQDIPKQFNSSFLNPCWYDSPSSADRTLKCLPYYFLAGFAKCGTSDLYHKMGIHPQIRLTKPKEHHWWNTRRFPDLIDSWRK